MPFTFCHPAIILPLTKLPRSKISATGLIIGSMSPDFEYFIKMRMESLHGHSLMGLFYYDLPITIVLCFLFHLFVRDALILHLPEIFRKRFVNFVGLNWLAWVKRRWYVLIYSALIGIFSHVFWDAFTHTDGFFVERIPILQGAMSVLGVLINKAHFAQHMSTLFGGAFIVIALLWPQKPEISNAVLLKKITYWLMVLFVMSLILLVRNVASLGDFIATSISGWLIGLILAPLLLKLFTFKNG